MELSFFDGETIINTHWGYTLMLYLTYRACKLLTEENSPKLTDRMQSEFFFWWVAAKLYDC